MGERHEDAEPSVETLLFTEAYRFDFFQAVRLLERIFPERQPVGRGANPETEIVRFCAHLSLAFPPSALYEMRRSLDPTIPAHMVVAFMGLTGPLGVLPRHYTELLIERERRRDHVLRDFLDLFNHRMIALFYRAWEKYRVPIAYEHALQHPQEGDRFAQYLFDFMGLGTAGLQGRMQTADSALLFYTGLLAQRPHSASALAGVVEDYFGVPARIVQFVGEWLPLAAEHRSRLGPRQAHNALGVSAVAGGWAWDQQARFTVRVGPLTLAQFQAFLPTGKAFRSLVQLSRFVAGQECDFDVQLVLQAAAVPWCRLGTVGNEGPRLGWSAWLKSREFTHDAADAVFPDRLARLEGEAL